MTFYLLHATLQLKSELNSNVVCIEVFFVLTFSCTSKQLAKFFALLY
jgi:hypothetical protein